MTNAALAFQETGYALVGRSFTREVFEPLYQRSLLQRAERHARERGQRHSDGRRWHPTPEPVTLPLHLPA